MFDYLKALHQVMRDVKFSRSKLDKLIHARLKTVLISAYQHVSYYRELMQKENFNPIRDYRGPEDLAMLPITTKDVLKQRGIMAFVSEGANLSDCFSDTTSGSTGIPITVYRDPCARALQIAKWLRVLFVNGYSPHQRVMSLTSPSRLTEGRSIIQRFGILRRLAVDYLCPPEELVDILLTYKPHVLYGNRSHLDLMALELDSRGMRPEGLRLLIGGAEVIQGSSRQLYQEHFGVELIETYGSVEMGTMAYETPSHHGLNLSEDLTYFEFLDKEGNPVCSGVPGRVVVTDLAGTLMPFIRYDQGDIAVFENVDGTAGDTHRRIKQIIGREDDYAILPDGTHRPFHDFYEVMDKYHDIRQFRIVQKKRNLFHVLIVADTAYLITIRNDLLDRLRKKFPPTVNFELIQKERLEPDPSGKIRMLVSEID